MYNYNYPEDYLMHYGIKGMKWGKRKASYQTIGNRVYSRAARASQKDADNLRKHGYKAEADAVQKVADRNRAKASASQKKYDERNTPEAKAKRAKALKIGAAVAGTALAAYGAYKVDKVVKDKAYNASVKKGNDAVAKFMKTYEGSTEQRFKMQRNLNADVVQTAKNNSSTFARSVRTLKGQRQFSNAELKNMGLKTVDINRVWLD